MSSQSTSLPSLRRFATFCRCGLLQPFLANDFMASFDQRGHVLDRQRHRRGPAELGRQYRADSCFDFRRLTPRGRW